MAFSTTIKKIYWDMKMKDVDREGHFYEYKINNMFWGKRLGKIFRENNVDELDLPGVFLIGSRVERVRVVDLELVDYFEIPKKYRLPGFPMERGVWRIKCIPVNASEQEDK